MTRPTDAPSAPRRHVRVYVWTCPPAEVGKRPYWCKARPCHGHRALAGDVLVARVLAWVDGVDWYGIDHDRTPGGPTHDLYLRQARRFRAEIMHDERRPR